MGNSNARISERTTKPNQKPRKKRWPSTSTHSSFQHEERLRQFLLQQQMERRLDGPQQEPRQPVQGIRSSFNKEEAKVEEDNSRMEVRIDASEYKPEELKVSVQPGILLVAGRHEEKKEDGSGYVQRSFSRRYTLPKEAEADKMVSNLSPEGILVITTPKSAPALTDATHEAK